MKKLILITAAAALAVTLAALTLGRASGEAASGDGGLAATTPERWQSRTLEIAAQIPVQEQGRIKPLDTYARFLLLRLNGKRECLTPRDEKLSAMEWLLDCWFRPLEARDYRVLMIDNDEVLDRIGLPHDGRKKRDRYSYDELRPARATLVALASEAHGKKEEQRTIVETQTLNLASNFRALEDQLGALDFARERFDIAENRTLQYAFSEQAQATYSQMLERSGVFSQMREVLSKPSDDVPEARRIEALAELKSIDQRMLSLADLASDLALLPPPAELKAKSDQWLTVGDLTAYTYGYGWPTKEQIAALSNLEAAATASNPEQLHEQFSALLDQLTSIQGAHDRPAAISLEVAFYRGQYFYYSLLLFVLSFLLVTGSWLKPGSKLLGRSIPITQTVALALLIAGIVLRCVIRWRPPVTTLYETILFITAVAVLVALLMEWMNRQRVGQAMASVLGVCGLFLANKFEIAEASDTMPQMRAVLDTNFWLSTHVTTVTIGYAAGLLAGGIAHIWVIGKLLGFKKTDAAFYRNVTRMVYGVLCFGLVFSVIGTILGGIWANDSWGRFWGWDPKENGALLIVLWELAVLHARMGGHIKQPGLCLAAIFGGVIVAFSWWGVNFLDVGLHSYGGAKLSQIRALHAFYALEALVLAAGGIWLFKQSRKPRAANPQP